VICDHFLSISLFRSRSPYTPDPSMEMIFSSVNKAWLLSFYNTSKACQTSSVIAGLAPSQGLPLSADYLCPICAPKIRLTSISGGGCIAII
jgi:hypothetical protein